MENCDCLIENALCTICGKCGHWGRDCPSTRCYVCHFEGHHGDDCPRCNLCKWTGHWPKECNNICSFCGDYRHSGDNCDKVFCSNCNKIGHCELNCQFQNFKCTYCKKYGHIEENCEDKRFTKSLKNNNLIFCFICKEYRHLLIDCTKQFSDLYNEKSPLWRWNNEEIIHKCQESASKIENAEVPESDVKTKDHEQEATTQAHFVSISEVAVVPSYSVENVSIKVNEDPDHEPIIQIQSEKNCTAKESANSSSFKSVYISKEDSEIKSKTSLNVYGQKFKSELQVVLNVNASALMKWKRSSAKFWKQSLKCAIITYRRKHDGKQEDNQWAIGVASSDNHWT